MKACPFCRESIQDLEQVCPFCHANLAAPAAGQPGTPPPVPVNPETSGKAIASLVCGIFGFIFPAAIVAVIMGHLSLSDIRRSAGRLTGKGMAITGLVFGYLGLAVIPILIIAAIAIPNLLRAKMAANESSAVGSVRALDSACITYFSTYNSYPRSLANLGPSAQPGADAAGLIDDALASGNKNGYMFRYDPVAGDGGAIASFEIHADPLAPGASGVRHFFSDQTMTIHVERNGPASADSPPLF